ncbi:Fur family transcriptional regulator [Cellulomonas sp. KRMCY2]|uniref:Fur family transcriptional regulator n=1 Tax=Cellulomonas sp. KRMCY2 TaxID=1304865 RepID=UPI00045EAEE8|nr:Fur family transcriptional regulator [Cellulomonas sp. KRMCY2]
MTAHQALRDHGLRVTAPRIAVLDAVGRLPHATADTVLRAVRTTVPTVSVQTVYDVLHALTHAGLLREIEPAGHAARYERRVGDNHHHIVCRSCGALDDVDCAIGDSPCLVPSSTSGFTVELAEVTYWGLCPACREAA